MKRKIFTIHHPRKGKRKRKSRMRKTFTPDFILNVLAWAKEKGNNREAIKKFNICENH